MSFKDIIEKHWNYYSDVVLHLYDEDNYKITAKRKKDCIEDFLECFSYINYNNNLSSYKNKDDRQFFYYQLFV